MRFRRVALACAAVAGCSSMVACTPEPEGLVGVSVGASGAVEIVAVLCEGDALTRVDLIESEGDVYWGIENDAAEPAGEGGEVYRTPVLEYPSGWRIVFDDLQHLEPDKEYVASFASEDLGTHAKPVGFTLADLPEHSESVLYSDGEGTIVSLEEFVALADC